MRIGEIWRYKKWLIKFLNNKVKFLFEDHTPDIGSIQVRIIKIDGESVWFREVNTDDHEHAIHRETFIQIFEKDYSGEQDETIETR